MVVVADAGVVAPAAAPATVVRWKGGSVGALVSGLVSGWRGGWASVPAAGGRRPPPRCRGR